MDKEQVLKMKNECLFPDSCEKGAFFETHISWIVLTDHYAFKIKRPVKLSFLDFSTIEKRKFYCLQEIQLNKRLAPDMYIGAIPINKSLVAEDSDHHGDIIDYAVQMKKMDNEKEMHKLLADNKVNERQLSKLADKIARFHKNTRIINNAFDAKGMTDDFSDIANVLNKEANESFLSDKYRQIIFKCIERSKEYIHTHKSHFNQRIIEGYQRDCHGDLNATNVFLYEDPVIFDCIEFNEEFRYIDVLNEIAFLCVDLDFFGRKDLSAFFIKNYMEAFGMKHHELTDSLFKFYKCYRANIRAKVTLLSLKEHPDDKDKLEDVKKYINLMNDYARQL